MIETILSIISNVGTVANTASSVIDLVQKVKGMISESKNPNQMFSGTPNTSGQWTPPAMQPFQPQVADRFGGGQQWLPQLQNLAKSNGNSWVPTQTAGFMGINLTGIWSPPMNPYDQTYIRQYGPYINFIAGVGGMPTGYGEGLFDPAHWLIHVVGKNVYGVPMEARAQLFPNWVLQGYMVTINPYGMPMQFPLLISKVG